MQIRTLKPGFEALGVLMDFLAKDPPYAAMQAGDLPAAVTYQLASGLHVAGLEDKRVVVAADDQSLPRTQVGMKLYPSCAPASQPS